MSLTALKVRTAKPGRYADLHGLYLVVRESGSRAWVLRIQHGGKRRDFGLGPAHDVSLADARCLAAELRKMVRSGLNPVRERGLRRSSAPTFETLARRCYDAMKGGWKDRRHVSWLASLENHVFPGIGSKRTDAIGSAEVLAVLEPIWLEKPDTARRILQRIGTILDFAQIKGLIPAEVSLAQEKCVGRDALKLTVLTAVRSNEARFSTWAEFDLDAAVWSIPAARMKMKDAHAVPLAPAALALLRRLRTEHESLYGVACADRPLFSIDGRRPISDTTMLKAIRDMKIAEVTVHGFRSSFADWVAERTLYGKEVAEKALAHRIPQRREGRLPAHRLLREAALAHE